MAERIQEALELVRRFVGTGYEASARAYLAAQVEIAKRDATRSHLASMVELAKVSFVPESR